MGRREAGPWARMHGLLPPSLHLQLAQGGRLPAGISSGIWDAVCSWEEALKQQEEVQGLWLRDQPSNVDVARDFRG